MSMGLGLGLLTMYYTWRSSPATKDSIFTAAVLGSLYAITGISGSLYPGSKWIDPEFGEGAPQAGLFTAMAILPWVGYWLEMRG
jgi:hypothetical protein